MEGGRVAAIVRGDVSAGWVSEAADVPAGVKVSSVWFFVLADEQATVSEASRMTTAAVRDFICVPFPGSVAFL